jgi:hypothetical protein
LFEQSELFSSNYWVKTNVSVDSNAISSPAGVVNASLLIDDAVNSRHRITKYTSFTSGKYYTLSIFVKKNSSNRFLLINAAQAFNARAALNLDTLEITNITGTSGKVVDYGNEWYRFSVTGLASATGSNSIFFQMQDTPSDINYIGDGSSFYIWGAMFEQDQSYATSYIPTNGATSTRLQDIANNSGNATLFNSTEGVLYAEIAALADDGTGRVICLSDGTNSHRVLLAYDGNTNQIQAFHSNGVDIINLLFVVSDITNFHKIAFKYSLNDFALWVDGVEVLTDFSGTTNISNTFNNLKFENASGSSDFYGKTKALVVYKEALTDEQLTCLTTI